MQKVIAVTPRIIYEGTTAKEFVNRRYVRALLNRGFLVIMLTLENENTESLLEKCDGFLITGGDDIDPVHFGEINTGESKDVVKELDDLDKIVVEYALKSKKPLLGICRGHQSINVFAGGSLYQDIGKSHSGLKDGHIVHTVPNRLLNFKKEINVNSYHHQALKRIAPDFIEIAKHEDGTNEAIIHKTLPIIGIQWHPEMQQDNEPSKIIFDTFAKLVNNHK
ncbi:MAG: gamma-glutamyl-gamma-aminobutyrate hydrolase family protein [Bacilli bacterium]|jgi:putative glutamine amidotransferase